MQLTHSFYIKCDIITTGNSKKEKTDFMKEIYNKLKINPLIIFSLSILYLELAIKQVYYGNIFDIGLLYTPIFLIPIVILLTLLSKAFHRIINKIIFVLSMIIISVYFEVQYIFFKLFSVPFSFSTIGLADQAADFTSIIKDAILDNLTVFLLILIPLFVSLIFIKKIDTTRYTKTTTFTILIMFITTYLSTFLFLIPGKNKDDSAHFIYYKESDINKIIDTFGMITYTKVDIKRQIIGYEMAVVEETYVEPIIESTEEQPIVYKDNVIDIDFSSKQNSNNDINTLNNYFSNSMPTKQNEYTGMFEGKNIIFILAEGFNEVAVDEVRTPTLYKMINGGFVFNNFYSPVFLSTTGGEFQATTGLIPTQETLKLWKSEAPRLSFALGNAFGNIGYQTQSFHNWTYTYYKRNVTMGTLGFYDYLGCGNGLEDRMSCKWLPSDIDMINTTVDDYINAEGNFATYYVTVGGHSPYNRNDNIANKYINELQGTNYSEPVKYYLASQMELDKMLEQLINKLTEAGKLEDTVIALVGDHYPYTLTTEEMNEVSTYTKDGIIEVNRSNFIIWNSEIEEPIIVDKVGSQIDVLPTLLNLFGIEYDSRLIVGKDILSYYEGLAIFSNRSWVSDYGTYNANTRQFTLKEGKQLENINEYVKRINNRVANSFNISKMIIDNDYYKYILNQ